MEWCGEFWVSARNILSLLYLHGELDSQKIEYFTQISLWLVRHFNPFVLSQGLPFLQCSLCLSGKWEEGGGKKDARAKHEKVGRAGAVLLPVCLFPLRLKSSLAWFGFKGGSPTICILVLYIVCCTLLPNKYISLRSRDLWIQNWWADKGYLKESREVPPW